MTTKTLRLPDVLTSAVRDVGEAEHIEDSAAMRKLLRMGYDLYVAGNVTADDTLQSLKSIERGS